MSNQALIEDAAALIAEFDANAARVFLTQPFNRLAIVAAFTSGFRAHSARSLKVCDLVERVAILDSAARQLAA